MNQATATSLNPNEVFRNTRWVGPDGLPLEAFDFANLGSGFRILFCFQHNCPGCHSHGFPSLIELVEQLRGEPVRFAVLHTVFEEWEHNRYEDMLADQLRYALLLPFGHDQGDPNHGSLSNVMRAFNTGGTPWFIVIDPNNQVIHSHFNIDVARAVALIKRHGEAQRAGASNPNHMDWNEVLRRAREGNLAPPRRVVKSDEQWRASLNAEQFRVARLKGTERPHSSTLCHLFEPGRYHCVCCDTPLFDASEKFDSGSGWPSFTQAVLPNVVNYIADSTHGMQRIETTCAVCDAHLGHVFPDGPAPTGLRYCINAVSLNKHEAIAPGANASSHAGAREGAGAGTPASAGALTPTREGTSEVAVLAGGCFWGMQDLIRKLPGVISTRVGYSGGDVANATYRNHGSHAEAVEIVFDPTKITYRDLLEFFFQIHDPSTMNRQGNDRGTSYRSGIYYTTESQREVAIDTIADVNASGLWPGVVVTEIKPAGPFWQAEPEHQDYLQRIPDGYTCHFVRPGWNLPKRA